MRRLLPAAATVDPGDAYAGLVVPDPWVAIGMVTSLDGAVAIDGTSGALGGSGDRAAFRAVRSLPDVVLVGLGTAVAEQFRAAWTPRHAEARAARGQAPLPRLAIVTGSGEVPDDLRALQDEEHPPLVVTTGRGADTASRRVAGRAEVVVVDEASGGGVAPVRMLAALAERGLTRVVCEGGPTLNHALVRAGVVDELFVTIAPSLVGGGAGLVGEALPDGPHDLVLHELRVHGSELLCRYRWRTRSGR